MVLITASSSYSFNLKEKKLTFSFTESNTNFKGMPRDQMQIEMPLFFFNPRYHGLSLPNVSVKFLDFPENVCPRSSVRTYPCK